MAINFSSMVAEIDFSESICCRLKAREVKGFTLVILRTILDLTVLRIAFPFSDDPCYEAVRQNTPRDNLLDGGHDLLPEAFHNSEVGR